MQEISLTLGTPMTLTGIRDAEEVRRRMEVQRQRRSATGSGTTPQGGGPVEPALPPPPGTVITLTLHARNEQGEPYVLLLEAEIVRIWAARSQEATSWSTGTGTRPA